MNCRHCGTALPVGALFCVECGRSVAERELPTPSAPRVEAPAPVPPHPVAATLHCPQCGQAVEAVDIFCPECGFVLCPITGTDTSAIAVVPAPEPMDSGDEPDVEELPAVDFLAQPRLEDIEETRIVAARPAAERYVLQFSTGESVVVTGSGLVGRNPSAEPGEFVDELVAIFDVGKSVSKSHIEFGQESGRFWISDRYSTNGTIVRQPDAEAVRCEPGRRYIIARGTRVEIGEQFFIVS
ncbi:zinc-ribbon domain-containing protein [Protaetiibacter intestinalis]|uniref:zinc-ribbon domain-containing protein n=1 Tax=Protaetiibacter intestinalis TaxID=2419774 RepID=UPI001474AF57|nr:zinc-ribbon domain-containing protein [Protaetiibacter intestinalis]